MGSSLFLWTCSPALNRAIGAPVSRPGSTTRILKRAGSEAGAPVFRPRVGTTLPSHT